MKHRYELFSKEVKIRPQQLIEAMNEARKLSSDPETKKYSSFKEALKDLDK